VGALVKRLPLEGRAALSKAEVYLKIPIDMGEEKPRTIVQKGAIAYWPMGRALCIFYGETKPYSAVNLVGKVAENLELFSQVRSGAKIRVERV